MGLLTPLWQHLEDHPSVPMTIAGWRAIQGSECGWLDRLLRRTGDLIGSWPSPHPNSQDLTLVEHPSGRLVAVCDGDPMIRVEVARDDAALYTLDSTCLASEVACALGLSMAAKPAPTQAGIVLLGEWRPCSSVRVPAWIVTLGDHDKRDVCVRNLATSDEFPKIIFTLTDRWWPTDFAMWALQRKAVLVPLTDVVGALGNGFLGAQPGWGEYVDAARRLVGMTPGAASEFAPRYLIERNGEFWKVIFDGRESPPLKARGFAYLQLLVRFPMRCFSHEELSLLDHPSDAIDRGGLADASADKQAAAQYLQRLRELTEDEERAVAKQDQSTAEAARRSRAELSKHIRASFFRGTPRTQSQSIKNLRNRVKVAMTRAIDELRTHDAAAAQHFDGSIGYSGGPVYRPSQSISWQF